MHHFKEVYRMTANSEPFGALYSLKTNAEGESQKREKMMLGLLT